MKKIAVFLFEGAELFEIASFTDIFGWNNVVGLKKFRDIKLETISYKESIKCTWGGSLKDNSKALPGPEQVNKLLSITISSSTGIIL